MKAKRLFQWGLVLAGFLAVAAPQPALAGLHIDLVFIDDAPPPPPSLLVGGGNLREIVRVAAENWERVFKHGGGKWNVTIEFGWAPLGNTLFGQERLLKQGGNPVRITRSRILFNNSPPLPDGGANEVCSPIRPHGTIPNTCAIRLIERTSRAGSSISAGFGARQPAMARSASTS
jgi:hypothetical protein